MRGRTRRIPLSLPGTTDLAVLAAEHGVGPVTDFDALLGHFWPEEERADEFIAAMCDWRHEHPDRAA